MKVSYKTTFKDDSAEFYEKLKLRFKRVMFEMEADAKRYAAVDKGTMRQAINLKQLGDTDYELLSPVSYSAHVEFGTAPHVIVPVTAKALSWVSKDGKRVFAKKVNHPGTMAQPFMRPALFNAEVKLKTIIK